MKQPIKQLLGLLLAYALGLVTLAAQGRPELFVRRTHAKDVRVVAVTPNGLLAASGGADGAVILWEVATGLPLRRLNVYDGTIYGLAFVGNGRGLIVGGSKGIGIYDASSGRVVRNMAQLRAYGQFALAEEAEMLAAPLSKTILLVDTKTSKVTILDGHSDRVDAIAFQPTTASGGKLILASASQDATVGLWDVRAETKIGELKHFAFADVHAVAFSPDGKMLASGGTDYLILWDMATRQELRRIDFSVTDVRFSADGKCLIGAGLGGDSKIWDVATGRELQTFPRSNARLNSLAVSADEKILVSGGYGIVREGGELEPVVDFWDTTTGQRISPQSETAASIESLVVSPDGKTLVAGADDKALRFWDLQSDTGPRVMSKQHHNTPVELAFSQDSRTLASLDIFTPPMLWEARSGRLLNPTPTPTPRPTPKPAAPQTPAERTAQAFDLLGKTLEKTNFNAAIALRPDGQQLAYIQKDGAIALTSVPDGRMSAKLDAKAAYTIAYNSDATLLAAGSDAGAISLWEMPAGKLVRTLTGHTQSTRALAFSHDGKLLASGSNDGTLRLWQVSDGASVRSFAGYGEATRSVRFSPDGTKLVHGGLGNSVVVLNVADGRKLLTLKGHSVDVPAVAFSPDGRFILSGSQDASIKIWRAQDGAELATLLASGADDWLVITPDGLFDGSPRAWQQLLWRFNGRTDEFVTVEAFFSDFYYPGLLAEIMAGKNPRAAADIARKDIRQPTLKLAAEAVAQNPEQPQTARKLTLTLNVNASPAGARDVRLFRNGSLVKLWAGDVLNGKTSATLSAEVTLIAGKNEFTAYAFNRDNVKSQDAALTITGADSLRRAGVLYVLAVGVNQYAAPDFNLRYAVADARAAVAEVMRQQTNNPRFARVVARTLVDREATKANILAALSEIRTNAQPEDGIVIYFAGHGKANDARFYLIPHDLGYTGRAAEMTAANLQDVFAHSISDLELENVLRETDAGNVLFVIDACESGQALEAEEKRRGPMNSKGLAQLAYEKGMYILTAAQSQQAALEAAQLGHGFLTYALIQEGLKQGRADASADGLVNVREWFDYAAARVPQMQLSELSKKRELGFAFVSGEQKLAPQQRNVQRPRVFYRREPNAAPFVVARVK